MCWCVFYNNAKTKLACIRNGRACSHFGYAANACVQPSARLFILVPSDAARMLHARACACVCADRTLYAGCMRACLSATSAAAGGGVDWWCWWWLLPQQTQDIKDINHSQGSRRETRPTRVAKIRFRQVAVTCDQSFVTLSRWLLFGNSPQNSLKFRKKCSSCLQYIELHTFY